MSVAYHQNNLITKRPNGAPSRRILLTIPFIKNKLSCKCIPTGNSQSDKRKQLNFSASQHPVVPVAYDVSPDGSIVKSIFASGKLACHKKLCFSVRFINNTRARESKGESPVFIRQIKNPITGNTGMEWFWPV